MHDDDFESQWTGSPLAEAMGMAYRSRKDWYREYIFQDYKFRRLGKISKEQALSLVNLSPVREEAQWRDTFEVTREDYGEADSPIVDLMNKGAVPVTAPDRYDGAQIWVYKHDDTWYLAAPPSSKKDW